MFRHHFQATELSRTVYDILTCLMTRMFISYTTTPFILLDFGTSLRVYLKLFMCLHIVGLATVFVFPRLIRGNSSEKKITNVTSKSIKKDDSVTKPFAKDFESPKKETILAEDKITTTVRKEISENGSESDEKNNSSSSSSSTCNSMNDISDKNHPHKTDTNFLLKDIMMREVNKIKGETDNLSHMLMEKIEAANIEGFIDKTVNGIVELKDDLMRMNEPEVYGGNATEGLRKRNLTGNDSEATKGEGVDAFLKKEIDAIKEANVLPAVLSNGHAK